MKLIVNGRAGGKTSQVIMESARTGRYILAADQRRARSIYQLAQSMNIKIPYPVTAEEIKGHRLKGSSIRKDGVIVDEAIDVLQALLPAEIKTATLTYDEHTEPITDEERQRYEKINSGASMEE